MCSIFGFVLLAKSGTTRSANFLLFYEAPFLLDFLRLRSGALGFGIYIGLRLAVICRTIFFCFCFLVFGLVSGYDDCNYNKANHTHNYHHFQVLQPEFPLEFAGLLFKL